jgi:membrane fusion protein, multidrug efflux system
MRRGSHEHSHSRSPALAVILSIVCVATGCARSGSSRSENVDPGKTISVAAGSTLGVRTFAGRVDPSKEVELAFQVAGVLVNLPVKEGQKVAKGQMVAQLRPAEFQARLEAAQGQLDQARAALDALRRGERPEDQIQRQAQERVTAVRLANARAELDRYAGLVQSGAVSRSEYELAATNYAVAEEDHKAAQQLIEQRTIARNEDIVAQEAVVRGLAGLAAEAKLQLEDSTLRAPYGGVVAQRFVGEGQSITVNKPVIRFQSVDALDIVANLPATVVTSNTCSPNITAMFAEINGAPGVQYPVHIKEVVQVADRTTQTVPVRFEMKALFGVTVLPGMAATVSVEYRLPRPGGDRTSVPESSLCKLDALQR